ncbi:MAG TPA: hypothetical protein VMW17_21395 [Candidatus Binatia bacterium]|nr:hypothetical protein [Candidatus Binatia bacterium]
MDGEADLADLVEHLGRSSRLEAGEARRLIDEVLSYFGDTVEQFVRRRHSQLQAEQYKNEEIFDRISAELRARRFAAPPLSARQIRRLIYG